MEYATNPVDGVQLAHRSTGSGPPVVLVHGTALSQVIWRGFGYLRDLAADHEVITLDLRGHGRSEKPHEQAAYEMDLLVGDVLAVLDARDVEVADYVGYSLGGRVGFSLADARPGRVRRLVSAAGATRNQVGAFDRVFFPGCIEALESGGMDAFLDGWQAVSADEGGIDAPTRAAFAANDPLALAAYMRCADRDLGVPADRLTALTAPTLLLVGSEDTERLGAAQDARAVIPAAQLVVLPGATHGDLLRHPDALPAIRAFLDG